MSLWFCIFDEDGDEISGGSHFGRYSDFGCFRYTIAKHLRADDFPTLMYHSDCDGEWGVAELPQLRRELQTIAEVFRSLPPEEPQDAFGRAAFEFAAEYRAEAQTLYDCFHNCDGDNIFELLIDLCDRGIQAQRPILFR
jgi:hypothetical protein